MKSIVAIEAWLGLSEQQSTCGTQSGGTFHNMKHFWAVVLHLENIATAAVTVEESCWDKEKDKNNQLKRGKTAFRV